MTEITRAPEVRQRTLSKVRVLLDALPYMREHAGSTVVIKLGGAAMAEPRLAESFAEDVALITLAGIHAVVVHGGGPQINALAKRLGIEPRFVNGLRVTDEDTLDLVRMVLLGKINKEIVATVNRQGVPAVGLSGDDGALVVAEPKKVQDGVDLGLVGDIVRVKEAVLRSIMAEFVPVVASTAADERGRPYNVNADETAAAVAAALKAEKLIYLTDVPGLYEDVDGMSSLISEVSLADCRRLVDDGVATGGMVPKVEGVIRAMEDGVGRAHILDGRVPHALILELFTPEGLGTMVTHEVDA